MESTGSTSAITSLLCASAFVVVVLVIFLANAIRIVPEYERVVVFRLGRLVGKKGPGLILLVPIIDRAVKVDLREQERDLPSVKVISKDDIALSVVLHWNYKVMDPALCVTSVGNFELSAAGMAVTALRAMAKEMPTKEILARRDTIQEDLRSKLDEITGRWGVKATYVEMRDIQMPPEIREALDKQIIDENIKKLLDPSLVGADGMTQTIVHTDGKVMIDGRSWDAVSKLPILPATKVRVERVILEVAKDPATPGSNRSK